MRQRALTPWLRACAACGPTLIVLEATGGLERPLVRALVAAALPVVVANPRHVRDCAKATGQLAKTDRLDALVLARFAEAVRARAAGAPPTTAGYAHCREEPVEHRAHAGPAPDPRACDLADGGAGPPQRRTR